jgi:hypothetical protein
MFYFCANNQQFKDECDVDQYNLDVIGGSPPLPRRCRETTEVAELLVVIIEKRF